MPRPTHAAEINGIEEMMITKMQQRAPARMNEDTFIVKTFRYYDLGDTGHVEFDKFKRALTPFSSGIADGDLTVIFDRYGQDGLLNYKAFASEFVSGIRRNPGLAPESSEMYETVDDTLARIRDFLYSHGPRGIIGLAAAFRNGDAKNTRLLDYEQFHHIMQDFFTDGATEMSVDAIDQLFQSFREAHSPNQIAYDELFMALKVDVSPERRAVIRQAFRRLDTGSEGLVDINSVVDSYNARRHPQVSEGSRDADDMVCEFTETLQDLVAFRRGQRSYPTNLLAWEEFEDYYRFISGCYETDAIFCNMLLKVWDIDKVPDTNIDAREAVSAPAAGHPAKGRVGLHHWTANTLPEHPTYRNASQVVNLQETMLNARRQVAQRGIRAAIDVVKEFFVADDDVDDLVDVYEFRHACQGCGLSFRDDQEQRIFEVCDDGTDGGGQSGQRPQKMRVSKFLQLFHGAMSDERVALVRQVWSRLAGDPEDQNAVISPTVLKDNFACEAHPHVTKGEVDPVHVMNEFLDSFSLLAHVMGGCRDGMVSFSDFMAYYEVVSSTIENDSFFDLNIHRLWSISENPNAGSRSNSPPRRPIPAYDRPTSPMAEAKPPRFDGPSVYATKHVPDPREHEVHRRFLRQEAGPCIADHYGGGVSPLTKSSIIFDEEASSEISQICKSLSQNISRRGLKGWVGFITRFNQYDYKRNGCVMKQDWERIHKSMGLGLSPEEREHLFKGLSGNRHDGAMDFSRLINSMKPPLKQRRADLVSELYHAFQDQSGRVSAAALKKAFLAERSPQCVLHRKPGQQVAQDLYEAVDFFAPDGAFSAEGFVDFFTTISVIHAEDDEFRLMTNSAFGIGSPGQ